jgi:EpsG family
MDFIPIQLYNKLYYFIILIFVLAIYFNSLNSKIESNTNIKTIALIGLFLFIFVFFYMALRPISVEFGDMWTYAKHFEQLQNGEPPNFEKDPLFEYMTLIFSKFSSAEFFFFFCTVLYVIPIYFVTKKLFNDYWVYAFLILISSLSFWAYGTNGIRNGLATSIFLIAVCQKNNFLKFTFFLIALLFHKSLILPVFAYFISLFYKNSKTYFYIWMFAIPFSFIIGSALENFFLKLGFGGADSLTSYLGEFDQESEGEVIKIGFRWDFIVYSATAVYAAWYFIIKKKYNDAFYNQLVNIYLICNTLWILIIRANYSNRFAYLSWFMLGLITIYPMLKFKFFNNQHVVIGRIILAFFALTLLLNVILLVKA